MHAALQPVRAKPVSYVNGVERDSAGSLWRMAFTNSRSDNSAEGLVIEYSNGCVGVYDSRVPVRERRDNIGDFSVGGVES